MVWEGGYVTIVERLQGPTRLAASIAAKTSQRIPVMQYFVRSICAAVNLQWLVHHFQPFDAVNFSEMCPANRPADPESIRWTMLPGNST